MNETIVTVVGNLVDDPRTRTTDSGIEVTGFRVASTARRFDREADQWIDGSSVFLNVNCWRAFGTNVEESLGKGDPVIVYGRLYTRRYERDGQARSAYELDAIAVGPDLARGTATFQRTHRGATPPTFTEVDEDGIPPITEPAEPFGGRTALAVVGIGS